MQFWRRCGLKASTVAEYCRWIRLFRKYCRERRLTELHELTLAGACRFAEYYARHHWMQRSVTSESARGALHAWSQGLAACRISVPTWKTSVRPQRAPIPVIRQFIEYRRRHAGLSVFIRRKMPYVPFVEATFIRCMLTHYARKAGVTNGCLGSHVLRHSQATRQVELGTPLKVVGDILGHRNPKDTSHYTRSAVRRLRGLALPLPHA